MLKTKPGECGLGPIIGARVTTLSQRGREKRWKMLLTDVLAECWEALSRPTNDLDDRRAHLDVLEKTLRSNEISPEIRDLLSMVRSLFEQHASLSRAELLFRHVPSEEAAVAYELRNLVGNSERYLYHGTIFGRLKEIANVGLVPARHPVWKNIVEQEYLEGSVFFDTSWRGAMDWALMAQAKARGPRSGKHRMIAVIRIASGSHHLESDVRATRSRCVFVKGTVSVPDAQFFVGEPKGIPFWVSLSEMR